MIAIGNFGLDASIRASERDIKAAELLAALGLDPASSFWYELSVTGVRVPGPDSYLVTDTSLTNTPVENAVVPEPGSLLLLGTGLIGVVRALRRNHAAKT